MKNKDNKRDDYKDIIDMPHHVSTKHKPMPRKDRAAQFASFAALTGYKEVIDKTSKEHEKDSDF